MPEPIRFLLGYEALSLPAVDPNLTLLRWLRSQTHTGTKEGCAEGDCGACTVVLAEPDGEGKLRYRAVNACILLLPAVHGRQLITVEHLRDDEGRLHPVQQALVEHHASQCGFCTPGFVMSLFALYHNERHPSRAEVQQALVGNLCRCTGYRPILDAAHQMQEAGAADHFTLREAETVRRLQAMGAKRTLEVYGEGRRCFVPRRVDDLAQLYLDHPEATLVAGATDIGLWVTKQHRRLDTWIATSEVRELRRVEEHEGSIVLGAAVTLEEASAAIAPHYPEFGQLLRRFASPQIRNTATLGGNIANASPIGDSMPMLLVLGAALVLRRGDVRRSVPLASFFLDYRRTALADAEFIEKICIPLPKPEWILRCYKISKRFDQDISALCAAFYTQIESGRVVDVRMAFGGMAATPVRATRTEAALRGQPWDEATVKQACALLDGELKPLSDMRASARYRTLVARNLLYKHWLETSDPAAATGALDGGVVGGLSQGQGSP